MDSSQEISPAPSISSKGFKGALTKARISRKNEPTSASTTEADDSSDRTGIRNSVDSLLDRARSTRATTVDDGLPSGPSKLSKLIPGRVEKKRRKREEAEQAQKEAEDGRGRSVDDVAATSAGARPLGNNNRSGSSLGDGEGSLITFDSDLESPTAAKPPLVNHNSHIGYLTTSSPLIKTNATANGSAGNDIGDSQNIHNPQYQKSNTLPTEASGSPLSSNLEPQHAATFHASREDNSSGPGSGRKSRGVSPGAKIKDVFAVGSRKKGVSPPKSPDCTLQASGNGSAIGSLFNKGTKRNSMSLGKGSEASDSVAAGNIVEPTKSPTTATRDPPTVITTPNTPTSNSLEAPETTVTPPTPTDPSREFQDSPLLKPRPINTTGTNVNTVVSPAGTMISHRRVRSDSASVTPSKLSQATSAPLTPMIEESRTPSSGVRPASQSSAGGGFFSSMFTAAQNVTNTLTNTMANPTRSRSSTQTDGESVIIQEPEANHAATSDNDAVPVDEKKPLAVDTLGSGELSLSHLGISSDSLATGESTLNGFTEKHKNGIPLRREEAAARAEDASAARAVSAAYSEKPTGETPVAEDKTPSIRPRSTYEASIATGEKTPPNGSIYEGGDPIRRSGSVRSRVGGVVRKHRNSSSATGNTIGAAIGVGASLANPISTKATGFAVASKKRNREFHQLFKSVPEDDYLIEDYSCALQREIILAGRIYISEGHICFSSNILGWVTTLIISFDEVVSVEKENTAMVFPNAIAIQTLHARHTFRSLLSREATYELLIGIWKLSHPHLKSSLNGARLDQGGTGDKTEKVDPSGSGETSEVTDEEEEVYDEDQEENEDVGSVTENGGGSGVGSVAADDSKPPPRKVSAMGVAAGAAAGGLPTSSEPKAAEKAASASVASADFPGPQTHAPTECTDADSHYDKFLKDDIIPAPLGKVYSMVFGPASGGFMAKWLVDGMKCTDLQFDHDNKGLTEENRSRSMTYIKPLYASIGPKTTKCVVTETLDFIDLERSVSVTASTQTPDVPSGTVFVTKTHFCFMWAANNATRVIMNYTIEWTGKSWLKGPIEKGATDGQTTYCNDLVKALKAGVSASHSRASTTGSKIKPKVSKRRKLSPSVSSRLPPGDNVNARVNERKSTWGPLEPLHGIVSPVANIFAPLVGANTIIWFLLFIIFFNYLRGPKMSSNGKSPSYPYLSSADRLTQYEELWHREESDLWDWLDQRVATQGEAHLIAPGKAKGRLKMKSVKRNPMENVRMTDREVEMAIKTTEEKLKDLKRVLLEKKSEGRDGADADLRRQGAHEAG
ncbi:MAG: hypothetical protein Q9217_002884 [Psora testacea]